MTTATLAEKRPAPDAHRAALDDEYFAAEITHLDEAGQARFIAEVARAYTSLTARELAEVEARLRRQRQIRQAARASAAASTGA